MKRKLPLILVIVLLIGGFLFWRWRHPALTDEQQIAANMDALCAATDNKAAKDVVWYLAPDFQLFGMKKKELQNQLVGGFLQYSVVQLTTSDVKIDVTGEKAHSDGLYEIQLKRDFNSSPEKLHGEFDLYWRKIDGEWKVTDVQGLPQNLPGG